MFFFSKLPKALLLSSTKSTRSFFSNYNFFIATTITKLSFSLFQVILSVPKNYWWAFIWYFNYDTSVVFQTAHSQVLLIIQIKFLRMPRQIWKKMSSLTLLRNNSEAGEPFEGFYVDLGLYVETWECVY